MSDQVYRLLRESIVAQDLEGGRRVVESDVARQLGVSQAPVREAVRRLAQEGLLTYVPRRGNFVTKVASDDVAAARQVREPLEALAAKLATARLTKRDMDSLTALVADMCTAVGADEMARFRELDIAFHTAVVRLAENALLVHAWEAITPQLQALRVISDPLFEGDWMLMALEHGHLVDALAAGDPEFAASEFADHAGGRVWERLTSGEVRARPSPSVRPPRR